MQIVILLRELLNSEKVEPKIPLKEFKAKNDTMVVEITSNSSQLMSKQGFNIKIHGKQKLYSRTQFKLHSDVHDDTYLRLKLTCDIYNSLDPDSILPSYVILYINDKYFHFHVLHFIFE
ncbi:hypothetical protein H8356DRAFT_1081204 [Neocallimastix lanati (nom. inval.)]|uniref:Uncharacterized protein n=1 Tax=Neocallimastix californiae TaxID=1754190 RepID=A0A1Y1Z8J4_9FUNG|nr:hypothetical protein H8356DRAFT_1081204 [Neocallimastix sp. JGI-2020a]ORY06424.1 hypothetical protein LY90DRAFT_519217 [Neocallimastix californiae]|eukprot:ORY06424.1 hypothetical protein LY90DRAFT_519217 [Neocallimastix californiae]